jgi:hypothetical protein
MSSSFSKAFLVAKRDFDHAVFAAIKEAATRFHEQTGLVPATIEFHAAFDGQEGKKLDYVLNAAKIDFNLDEVS